MNTQFGQDAPVCGEGVRWERVAEPQTDRYDTSVALRLAAERGLAVPCASGRLLFDGAVGITPGPDRAAVLSAAACDDPVLDAAFELMRHWPQAFEQFPRLVTRVEAYRDPSRPQDSSNGSWSSAAGGFGRVAVTLGDAVGAAEGLVFGLALNKLAALGVGPESGGGLIAGGEPLPSPLRFDALCAPSEAFCHLYGTAYCLQLDLAVAGADSDQRLRRRIARASVAWTLPRLIFGRRMLQQRAEFHPDGRAFLEGLLAWLQRMEKEADEFMAAQGVALAPFSHPLEFHVRADHRPRRCSDVQSFAMDDELLLYAPGRANAFTLNLSARAIWDLCDGSRTVSEIAGLLARESGTPEPALYPDVAGAVQAFVYNGLVTVLSEVAP